MEDVVFVYCGLCLHHSYMYEAPSLARVTKTLSVQRGDAGGSAVSALLRHAEQVDAERGEGAWSAFLTP